MQFGTPIPHSVVFREDEYGGVDSTADVDDYTQHVGAWEESIWGVPSQGIAAQCLEEESNLVHVVKRLPRACQEDLHETPSESVCRPDRSNLRLGVCRE